MKISLERFLEVYEARTGLCSCGGCQNRRKIRPYACGCSDPHCSGWIMVHDANVRLMVALGRVHEAAARAYRRQLGKRYDTKPWIYSAQTVMPDMIHDATSVIRL